MFTLLARAPKLFRPRPKGCVRACVRVRVRVRVRARTRQTLERHFRRALTSARRAHLSQVGAANICMRAPGYKRAPGCARAHTQISQPGARPLSVASQWPGAHDN